MTISLKNCLKMLSLSKYINPFQGLAIYEEYIKTIQLITSHKDAKTILKLRKLLAFFTLKSIHLLYLALLPLTPVQRVINFDAIFIVTHNSSLNLVLSTLCFMHVYICGHFFTTPNSLNNSLLQEILFKGQTNFFNVCDRKRPSCPKQKSICELIKLYFTFVINFAGNFVISGSMY